MDDAQMIESHDFAPNDTALSDWADGKIMWGKIMAGR